MQNKPNENGLGSAQRDALDFAKRVSVNQINAADSGWHGFNNDYRTRQIIRSLEQRELVEVNQYLQFRVAR